MERVQGVEIESQPFTFFEGDTVGRNEFSAVSAGRP